MSSLLDATTVKPRISRPGGFGFASIGLTILHHPDPARVGELASLFDLDSHESSALGRNEPEFRAPSGALRGALSTPLLSRKPIALVGQAGAAIRVETPPDASALVVDGTPCAQGCVLDDARVRAGVVLELADSVVLLLHVVELYPRMPDLGLIGDSAAMQALRAELLRVADLQVPVLLRGETGAGKELVAQAIHAHSTRKSGPFVTVNTAALADGTAAAELFGHDKGAFTGADSARRGFFERADGGSLLLDEIGDLPEAVQPMLLRVLETGELQRVGGSSARADVRVLSATDADLEAAVAQGRFREPLLQRLRAYELRIPSLRERRQDIGQLLLHFLRKELQLLNELDKLDAPPPGERGFLRASFVGRLARHAFPGNVRELANFARRIAISSRGNARMHVDDGLERLLMRSVTPPPTSASEPPPSGSQPPPGDRPSKRAAELSDDELVAALRQNAFSLNRTAAALRVSRTFLNTRIERCPQLRKAKDLARDEVERAHAQHGGDLEAMAAQLEVSPRGLQLQMKRLGLR